MGGSNPTMLANTNLSISNLIGSSYRLLGSRERPSAILIRFNLLSW
jgi:hypothetical protein